MSSSTMTLPYADRPIFGTGMASDSIEHPQRMTPVDESTVLDTARMAEDFDIVTQLRALDRAGFRQGDLIRRFARLMFGPGRIAFRDFIRLRLFDDTFLDQADPARFVGQRRNRDLVVEANFRHDWFGLMSNKVAVGSFLAAHGISTIPQKAVFARTTRLAGSGGLLDEDGLAAFLLDPQNYPLFGKPCESFQSLGALGLDGCDPDRRCVRRGDGTWLSVDSVVAAIADHYPAGYLFQPCLRPHADIAAVTGGRIATVRIITASDGDAQRVFRAAWKIPAGGNTADNFWRAGNLLAALDLATGAVGHVVSGSGLNTVPHVFHPDTGTAFAALRHPQWDAACRLALSGAEVLRHMPLIGWDVACTDQGPVIVEANESPDFFLVQFADRRGVLDQDFKDFLTRRSREAEAFRRRSAAAVKAL